MRETVLKADIDAIVLHEDDSVATALKPLAKGAVARVGTPEGILAVTVVEDIRRCHKFALVPIPVNTPVCKYGEIIGDATQAIAPGAHVHVHNLVGRAGKRPGGIS